MSYPKNATTPPRIAVGAVVQISDGAVQASGVSIRVVPQGGSAAAGLGTTTYEDGIVLYAPTQAETNYDAVVIIAYKTGCIPASTTVVTSASSTAGYGGVDWSKVTSATATVNLSNTTIKTATDVETDTQDIQSRLPAALVSGRMDASVGAYQSGLTPLQPTVAGRTLDVSAGGEAGIDWANIGSPTSTVAFTNTTIATSQIVATVSNRVSANTDQWGGVAVTGMPMPTYSQPTGFLAATFPGTVASTTNITTVGAVSGSVGSVTGNVSGSVGSISGVTFPANFGVLMINSSGHISRVTLVDTTTTNTDMRGTDGAALASVWTSTVAGRIDATVSSRSSHSAADVWAVATRTLTAFSFSVTVGTNNDKTGYSLATAPLDASGTAAAVWGALLASYTTAGTFGARILRTDSASAGNGAKVTGAGHVAADIHELQPAVIQASHFDLGAIDANALAADAAAEIAASVWSAATRTLTAFSFAITVDAASIRSAIGMAAANLDTQLDAIPTAVEIDTQLTANHGAGSWAVGGTGSGAFTLTITVNDGTNPLQNATVRMVEGVNAYVGQTNASGVMAFSLDAATYSVAITKDGYSFTPTTKVVSATGSQTYSMTQITPTLPAAAGLSTGTAICYGTTGLPIAGVVVTIQQIDGKGVAGSAYDGDTFTLTSNAQGVISHNGFVRGAVYSIRRGIRGEVKSFVVPDAASFDLSEIVGRD